MQVRPPLSEIERGHQVDVIRGQLFDLVLADEDLAEARAVDLDGGIVRVLRGGGLVAEDQRAAAELEDFAGAFVVGGIEAKRLRRARPRR